MALGAREPLQGWPAGAGMPPLLAPPPFRVCPPPQPPAPSHTLPTMHTPRAPPPVPNPAPGALLLVPSLPLGAAHVCLVVEALEERGLQLRHEGLEAGAGLGDEQPQRAQDGGLDLHHRGEGEEEGDGEEGGGEEGGGEGKGRTQTPGVGGSEMGGKAGSKPVSTSMTHAPNCGMLARAPARPTLPLLPPPCHAATPPAVRSSVTVHADHATRRAPGSGSGRR